MAHSSILDRRALDQTPRFTVKRKTRLASKDVPARKVPASVSYRMSRIRSKDTAIEIAFRSALAKRGMRFRKHYSRVQGSPDIAFVSARVAVFCDSSFWHGRNWRVLQKRLRTNREFWIDKISKNMARDRRVNKELKNTGWTVLRFWEEDISQRLDWCLDCVIKEVERRRPKA